MKNKVSALVKRMVSVLSSVAKAKSMAIKSKTNAVKARLIMFSLMKNKKVLMDSLSQKVHSLLQGQHAGDDEHDEDGGDESKAIILYNTEPSALQCHTLLAADEDDAKYPDLRHCLFDDDLQHGGSVIDMVRNSKEEGVNFRLEDEIDHVADLFINRFHKQMRMQKLESFKRLQEMLERSV